MKKFVATILLIGTAFTASACGTNNSKGHYDEAPYADERTVGSKKIVVIKEPEAEPIAERIFAKEQVK